MALLWAAVGTVSAVLAIYMAYVTVRVWRSNPAIYQRNQEVTGNFYNAAIGRVHSLAGIGATDFHINHFVEPCVSEDESVTWERAASLSDEAVDSVLARH
jgi:hypothetical protein